MSSLSKSSEGLDAQWMQMYEQLKEFHREHGHTRVSTTQNRKLAIWVYTQRKNLAKNLPCLTPKRKELLNKIGLNWELSALHQAKWMQMYEQLKEFHRVYGHTLVPTTQNKKLADWVCKQRRSKRRKESCMTPKRKELLEQINFNWGGKSNPSETRGGALKAERWAENYQKLKAYYDREGNSNVPTKSDDPDIGQLGTWVAAQRQSFKRGELGPVRTRLLKEVDFAFDRRARSWDDWFSRLVEYNEKNGHCDVPHRYKCGDGMALGHWVNTQRRFYKKNQLQSKRLVRLLEIGFVFSSFKLGRNKTWDQRFQELKDFKEVHCHLSVPSRLDGQCNPLYSWVAEQRRRYAAGKMNSDRQKLLERIGFGDPTPPGKEGQSIKDPDVEDQYVSVDEAFGVPDTPYKKDINDYNELGDDSFDDRGTRYEEDVNRCDESHDDDDDDRGKRYDENDHNTTDEEVVEDRELPNNNDVGERDERCNENRVNEPFKEHWDDMFRKLKAFQEKYGHTKVPRWAVYKEKNPELDKLSNWVTRQRKIRDKMLPHRREKLESIGFQFVGGRGRSQDISDVTGSTTTSDDESIRDHAKHDTPETNEPNSSHGETKTSEQNAKRDNTETRDLDDRASKRIRRESDVIVKTEESTLIGARVRNVRFEYYSDRLCKVP